jgi:hypothetical protein
VRIIPSQIDRLGPLVVVIVPETAALVLTFDDPTRSPHDLTSESGNLVLLSLSEPPATPGVPLAPQIEPARVSLLMRGPFAEGELVVADQELANQCFAAMINPFTGDVFDLNVFDVLAHVAKGVAVQIAAGVAAVAARNLDAELEQLSDRPTEP